MPTRLAVLSGIGLGLALIAAMRLVPLQTYWVNFFEPTRAYLWWPGLVVISAFLFIFTGYSHYKRNGRPLFHPYSAFLGAFLLLIFTLVLITEWGVDWSSSYGHSVCIILGLAFTAIGIGWIT